MDAFNFSCILSLKMVRTIENCDLKSLRLKCILYQQVKILWCHRKWMDFYPFIKVSQMQIFIESPMKSAWPNRLNLIISISRTKKLGFVRKNHFVSIYINTLLSTPITLLFFWAKQNKCVNVGNFVIFEINPHQIMEFMRIPQLRMKMRLIDFGFAGQFAWSICNQLVLIRRMSKLNEPSYGFWSMYIDNRYLK